MAIDFTDEELHELTSETLRCKADQSWELAGLARQDSDYEDARRHTTFARRCEWELRDRRDI